MKCIVLAGGKGDRLWPLSRKNYPKQFIPIQKNHSLFQETIARNIPLCDEFIIVTNKEYRFHVENQMMAFQGITYQCIYEEVGRKTTAAIIMACMRLPLSETVFVVPTDHLIEGEDYRRSIQRAKELSREGYLVTLGMQIKQPDTRFGYIKYRGEDVLQFVEKPDEQTAKQYALSGEYFINAGMFLFSVGDMVQELRHYSPGIYEKCREAYRKRIPLKKNIVLPKEVMEGVPAEPIERTVFEQTGRAKVVHSSFAWKDIGSLEDLDETELEFADTANQVLYQCRDTQVFNQCPKGIVVVNGLEDVLVVNTKDAVYVGKKGGSEKLKTILEENPRLQGYLDSGRMLYRQWGTYEILVSEANYVVRKVIVNVGKTIYMHKHMERNDIWSLVEGMAKVTLDGKESCYGRNEVVNVEKGTSHQISNIGNEPLIFIETSIGELVREEDLVSMQSLDITESELGYAVDPYIKLLPAFKDYLWGGSELRDKYGKQCEYDIIAESWELSAHEMGQSVVASGRHKGMLFQEYLNRIGRNCWGWKCTSLAKFPVLIKLIDAKENLSVQVHPDDEFAMAEEQEYGKNEMWYILECEENACLYCGFKHDATREEVEKHLKDGSILKLLNKIPVTKGESYFIPAGTVHAIGKGIMICEIQQSSNSTYRLYDYDRTDKYGNKRELHLEKALQVMNYKHYALQRLENTEKAEKGCVIRTISRCKYFECMHCQVETEMEWVQEEESFSSLICIGGNGAISAFSKEGAEALAFTSGDSIFIPAGKQKYRIKGTCELILTHI